MEEERIVLQSEDGTSNEYTLLLLFKSLKKDKEYILYTDETYDYDDNLNILARIFNRNNNSVKYIEDEEEWNEVESVLDKYIDGVDLWIIK